MLVDVLLVGVAAVLALWLAFRPQLTVSRGGKIGCFIALFILPALGAWAGFDMQMYHAETTSFCLSCHVMTEYGHSLYVDDPSYLPARHFQNNLVPRDAACYTCHTDYAMFGTLKAKVRGVRHLYVQYLGTIPKPENIKLYEPYNNRECLHCHAGARSYVEAAEHHKSPDMLSRIDSNQLSCMSNNCHDIVHDVDTLKDATFWKGGQ